MKRHTNYDDLLKKWHDLGLDEISKIHKVNAFNHFIKNLPTVTDVAEVKRGKWIYKRGNYMTGGGNPLWCCSVCGKVVGASLVPPKYSYCPNCGAKMD